MTELFQYEFMRRALVAAVLIGLVTPTIGTFLVQRRLALLGDGIGHVALTGVALGLLTSTSPVLTAAIVSGVPLVLTPAPAVGEEERFLKRLGTERVSVVHGRVPEGEASLRRVD